MASQRALKRTPSNHKSLASEGNRAQNEPNRTSERFDVALRAYVVDPELRPRAERYYTPPGPSEFTLVFDTETTTDSRQNLRFGSYQVYRGTTQLEKGLFFNPKILNRNERTTLARFAKRLGFTLRTASEFIEDVFFVYGYDLRASIVGFNLSFDLSRLACDYNTTRVNERYGNLAMRGGFSFKLSQGNFRPRIQVKHQSRRLAFIRFTAPGDPQTPGSMLKRKKRGPIRRGFFVDLKTAGDALTSQSNTLASLANFLGATRKLETSEHGRQLTEAYITYAVGDVQTTWECLRALRHRFADHRLRNAQLHSIYSEASLGKAYLKEMRIRPWTSGQPEFPPEMIGWIMSTYYGGRAEVHIRRMITQVYYCDFRSMYPTVCTLMHLWDFVIAEGMEYRDTTKETQLLLRRVELADLQSSSFWPKLRTIVQIVPDEDILPVRANYQGTQYNIGVNYVSCDIPLWYTLGDCVASKLLTGKVPKVVKAYSFSPKSQQAGLRKISIMGNSQYQIDPATQDFYKRLIDLRAAVRSSADVADTVQAAKIEVEQQAIKILANATSYGIFVELNVEELAEKKTLQRYGATEEAKFVASSKREKPGNYFHPLLGTLITGAARLMLAITESLAKAEGLDWAFCDTDSMAIANVAGLPQREFFERARRVCDWFTPLNPYESKGPLLETEDENWKLADDHVKDRLAALFCYAVSAKRYVLFNIGTEGKPILRKGLAHGLGHLYRPYEDNSAPQEFPAPAVPLGRLGVNRWQHDLWYRIVVAAMRERDTNSNPAGHAAFNGPAASRYHATTPEILSWFKSYNDGRGFPEQVKPFNFLLSFQARAVTDKLWDPTDSVVLKGRHRLTRPPQYPKPVAPYDSDTRRAVKNCFDRISGKAVPIAFLQPYSEALAQYHLHAEAKFLNGNGRDRGLTERRHLSISIEDIHYIGKETNELEEQLTWGFDPEASPDYGIEADIYPTLLQQVQRSLKTARATEVSRLTGMTTRYVRFVREGKRKPKIEALRKLDAAISNFENEQAREKALLHWALSQTQISRRELARRLGEDRRNLDAVLSGQRKLTIELLHKIAEYVAAQGARL